CMQGLAFPWTF
nr:immunoglobulin light chain junction region [Macaca mulatta]MOX84474.1 immunoglobulin light chain junction region [Macaca mulatta]MOX84810.1 immunoglobulin light chain junction region [Macaca mulatta]MOX89927.1 immunoglobulin light chain junction region [Macaca mulatta]MOX90439.1 immunoglobulin light chain junction region [Macaca mulatta]